MNRTELKLSLIDAFSKPNPVPIEHTPELFDLFKKEFWSSFKSSLENSIKNSNNTFSIGKICINWWHTSGHRLYNLYKESTELHKNAAFAAFIPFMVQELDQIGIPYTLEDDYTRGLKRFCFDVSALKKFSNAEQLGSLK